MKPAFQPRLVNHPFGDPGLYVELRYRGDALLFDLGRIDRMPGAALFKVSHVFVSHTHMDHFIGFDHLLRLFLARERRLQLFGPPGFLANVRGKLAGYTWNLIGSYPLEMVVHEIGTDTVTSTALPARTAFEPENEQTRPFDGIVVDDDDLQVRAAHLDHKIPSMGYALIEKDRLNVRPERLEALGIPAGRWLNELKSAVREERPADTTIRAEWREHGDPRHADLRLGDLRDDLLVRSRGQKLAYVVDTIFSRENMARICDLVAGADTFFCESLFLDADRHEASKRHHLTARQAGTLARAAGVRRLETFHFSPRYDRDPVPMRAEAQAVFRGELPPDDPD